ncbi:MAG: Arm DNA-binding domain-containing protein [Arenicella sp.]
MGRGGSGVRRASRTSYEITFSYRGERCRERISIKPSPANERRVIRHRAAIIDSIEKGTFDYSITFPESQNAKRFARTPGQLITVREHLCEWLDSVEHSLKASTYKDYRKMVLNQLIPAFGDLNLNELRITHVKAWVNSLNVTNKRVNNLLGPLRQAMAEAFEDELIDRNPLYGWKPRNRNAVKSDYEVDPFAAHEQEQLLSVLKGQAKNQIQFEFWTGLRPSELVALTWDDVDLANGYIRIDKALTEAAATPETTKTASGVRNVKLLDMARKALIDQKQFTFMKGKEVFQHPLKLQPWKGDQAIRKTIWIPAIKKAGLRYRNPYQTRHTYASMMLTAGESPLWLAKQMGHKDVSMIFKIYAKWIPESLPDAGQKAEELFGGNDNKSFKKEVK